jgi:L-arabinokinase
MKVERNTSVLPPPSLTTAERNATTLLVAESTGAEATVSRLLGMLRGDAPRFVATAPIRLDVLGGLSEYAGALVLGVPLGEHVVAGVQSRTDGKIRVEIASDGNGHGGFELAVGKVAAAKQPGDLGDGPTDLTLVVLAALAEGSHAKLCALPTGGVSVCVVSEADKARWTARDSAVAAATVAALAGLTEVVLDAERAAGAVRRVLNEWRRAPIGSADAVCAFSAEAGKLLQVHGDSHAVVPWPKELALVAIDCGDPQDDVIAKYIHVRVASYMGRLLIDRIMRHENPEWPEWDGRLARIGMKDFVERFRDRIPTRMKGGEFLERFGETGDPLTRIDPNALYKVRSRTEHHIYEHTRAREFVELMTRCSKSCDHMLLIAAGGLLDASHWSYGQRCGMGGLASDLLVNLIRRHGAGTEIYGSKVCGLGCGGTVAVMMKPTDAAEAALDHALDEYAAKTRRTPRRIPTGLDGVLVRGCARA